jgi:hypothetical protein
MTTALRIKTTVLSGGKIEIAAPELLPGAAVEVIILLEEPETDMRRSAVDILAETPGHRLFKNAEEVDAYVRLMRSNP